MSGRVYLEHGLSRVDVLRDVVAADRFDTVVAWGPEGPDVGRARREREAARAAGWRWAQMNSLPGQDRLDVSWAINQATGGLHSPKPFDPRNSAGNTDAGWFRDPIVDELDGGDHAISPVLPSLGRRPGVVYLGACEHYVDHPIYLYPGQTLRGAGVAFDALGRVVGGTRVVLRGPDARIVGIRHNQDPSCRYSCEPPCPPNPDGSPAPGLGSAALCYTSSFRGAGEARGLEIGWTPRTVLVVEGFAIVDQRARPARYLDRDLGRVAQPALDLVGVQLFQVRDCAIVAPSGSVASPLPRVGLRVNLPYPDPTGYFQRIERTTFRDWKIGIAYGTGSNTFSVRDCHFHVPEGGIGLRSQATGVRVQGCRFVGAAAEAVAVSVYGKKTNRFRGNRFEGFRRPLVLTEVSDVDGKLLAGSACNTIVPRQEGTGVPLVQFGDLADTLELGGSLAAGMVEQIVWLEDDAPGTPSTSVQSSGENLVRDVPMLGFQGSERWLRGNSPDQVALNMRVGDPGREPWFVSGLLGADGEGIWPEPGVQIQREIGGGPRGGGLAPPIRFTFAEPPANRIARVYIWQFLCPPSGNPFHVARAVQLANRTLAMSTWIRTNVRRRYDGMRWSSGVCLGLWNKGDSFENTAPRVFRTAVIRRSGVHSGLGAWELLCGLGAAVAKGFALDDLSDESGPAIRFGLEISLGGTTDGAAPYVELSTPFVSTSIFPQPPRTSGFTEAGGHLHGPLCPQLGSSTNVNLHFGLEPEELARTVVAADSVLHQATASSIEFRGARIAVVNLTTGALVAAANVPRFEVGAQEMSVENAVVEAGSILELRVQGAVGPVSTAMQFTRAGRPSAF